MITDTYDIRHMTHCVYGLFISFTNTESDCVCTALQMNNKQPKTCHYTFQLPR